jgi:hyperosmotically inducible periplasmic protein
MQRLTKISTLALVCLVALGFAACSTNQPVGEQLDDAAIHASIKAEYAASGDLNPFNIDVSVHDGVVTLAGIVEGQENVNEAIRIARETDGVTRVVSNLQIED